MSQPVVENISIFGNIFIFVIGDTLVFWWNKVWLLIFLVLLHVLEVPLEHQLASFQQYMAHESKKETPGPYSS